jgi:multimeric flavodoxin WrbA
MMIKVLGIIGSPRKDGNTDIMVTEALKTASENGAETEKTYLSDLDLKPCDGCKTCFETGECHICDDLMTIYRQVKSADGLILGCPVYFHHVTAQMKLFIDRAGYLNLARGRTDFKNKVAGVVVVAGGTGHHSTIEELLSFVTTCRMNIPYMGWVAGTASKKGEIAQKTSSIDRVRELATAVVELAKITSRLREKNQR